MTATKTCNNVDFKWLLLQRHVIMYTLNATKTATKTCNNVYFKWLLQRHVIMYTLNDCYKDM